MQTLDPVTLDIWWNRFISIVDEMAAALQRTAFSGVVREANDFCCALLDDRGLLIAQNTRTIPSFIGTISSTVRHFLRVFPPSSLSPDDVIVTNDPWVASGHLPDLTLALPIFYEGKLIGFCGIIFHMPDIGGRGGAANTRDFFEEGMKIPVVKLYQHGRIDPVVIEFIRSNVRIPNEVMGDIEAAVTATKTGEKRVIGFMDEYGLKDLSLLARAVQEVSERAMREVINKIPDGNYIDRVTCDGWDEPLTIQVSISVGGDEIEVDYEGTSPQSTYGINSVFNYTYAYTVYAIKCAICPSVPNNEGSCQPIRIRVPEGSLLNPKFPAPVSARYLSAHFIQAAIFGALARVIPGQLNADNSAPFWGLLAHGERIDGSIYVAHNLLYNGGQGASAKQDGISCLCMPSNVGSAPIEIIETTTGLMVKEKEFVADSAGPGKFRGGLAQRITIESVSPAPTRIFLLTDRIMNPARGYMGGKEGKPGSIYKDGVAIDLPKGEIVLNQGETLTLILPGGGGYGPPEHRDRKKIEEDLRNELVTPEGAKQDYLVSS